ncbi:unnamed protein product [Cuscuta epithymum]|uniref:RING-type E3 ubiquitin transferase n=1 Tax=Cuscuta epithymum TaxID=186058 RepID=A0AAV0CNY3_9ASTE|nr:unnamed protein product [Cuscuta epithymum]CAH9131683.1 unnamed protein product [Cuscuta epithymum]
MSSDRCSHWCYSCRQPVNLTRQNVTCPNCHGGFVQDLDEVTATETEYDGEDNYHQRQSRFMEAISSFLRRQMSSSRTDRRQPEPSNPSWNPLLIFSGDVPAGGNSGGGGGMTEFLNEALGFRREHGGGDYFIGPGVEEFFDDIISSNNNRSVPQAASRSSIESLPKVNISRKHVRSDLHCPVCKDKFEMGTEVRKLPCDHLYHADCIIPWLQQRNSCPVCRREMEPERLGDHCDDLSDSRSQSRTNSMRLFERRRERGRRMWSFLWPFRSSRSRRRGGVPETNIEATNLQYSHHHHHVSEYSSWPFE